ncbi:chloride channel protein [Fangia hongkongensis]|uniref:chloride channel protein n=1 Tax=Fangia hongkongensis TaxID=270495 RepID=UPI00035D3281|nr:chloride channel protein [Fangia hongkongensis]MBK2124271.1 chloride channel protein [Fangia hongkongensis]
MKYINLKALKKDKLFTESRKLMSFALWRRRLIFWGGAILVGLVCVLFAYLCDNLNESFNALSEKHPYWPLFITPVGFMVIVYLLKNYFNGAEGSGIPQVMTALKVKNMQRRSKLVSMRIALGKFMLTALGFLSGASIGREGPTIQLSASVMHFLGRLEKFNREDTERGLLLAGGAAGIAAAFNAPLAGVVFAIEELAGSFDKGITGTMITTVVLCGFVSLEIIGNYAYFGASSATIDILSGGWIVIIIVSVICGFLGGLFSRLLLMISGACVKLVREKPIVFAGVIGLIIAIIGVATHGAIYGSGKDIAVDLLNGHGNDTSIFYGLWKMIATLLSFISGIPGGIFAPSLSAGAGFGHMMSQFFAAHYASAIILIGTVSYFSGVVQSPITCFIIVSEMTRNVSTGMLLPIMLAALIGTAASRIICKEPVYHCLSLRYMDKLKGQPKG